MVFPSFFKMKYFSIINIHYEAKTIYVFPNLSSLEFPLEICQKEIVICHISHTTEPLFIGRGK